MSSHRKRHLGELSAITTYLKRIREDLFVATSHVNALLEDVAKMYQEESSVQEHTGEHKS